MEFPFTDNHEYLAKESFKKSQNITKYKVNCIERKKNKYRINPFGYLNHNYDIKMFNEIKPFLQKKMNNDILNIIKIFIGKTEYTIYESEHNKIKFLGKNIYLYLFHRGISICNDWKIDPNKIYMKRRIANRVIDLNDLKYEIVREDKDNSTNYEINFFNIISLFKFKYIYSIKFDECYYRFNEKEKNILKDPSKYNCNEICDRYFVNFIHKNILKNFKFIKYEDQKHDYFTFQNPENYNN